jgi:hypothetical protein
MFIGFVMDGNTTSSVFMAKVFQKDGKLKKKNLGQKTVQLVFKM